MKIMKKSFYTKMISLAAVAMLSASLASCVSETSDDTRQSAGSQGRLTINISSTPVGTRAATNIGSTSSQAGTKSDNEKTINRLVMAVYDNSASYARLMGKSVSSAAGTTYSDTKEFDTGGLADGDSIVVAANIPSDQLDTYADYTPMSNFTGNTLTIAQALTPATSGTLSESDLPMFGKSAVTADDTDGNFSATVNLRHLVAKVALNSLSVDFSATAHTSASFTPEAIFLINVPEKIDMQITATGGYCYAPTITKYYQGEADSWTSHASASQRQYADYLGTGSITEAPLNSSNTSMTNIYWLYTLPNRSNTYQTKLVIKGQFSIDGTEARKHDAYYAIALGSSTTDLEVQMNTIYQVTATIKGDGASDAYSAIPAYQNLVSTVTASDWTESGSVVTAGTGGMTYTGVPADDPVVGDLYFSDGTWGTKDEFPTKTPIGIVFSTSTSTTDYAAGYKRGYVMALTNVVYQDGQTAPTSWILNNGWCATAYQSTSVTGSDFKTTLAAVQADLDGLTHCQTAKTYCTSNSVTYSDLYAIYAATTTYEAQVHAPVSTEQLPNSGWYLPSIGQQYQWVVGLGNAHTTATWTPDNQNRYWYVNGGSQAAGTAINTAMENAGLTEGTDFDKFRNNTTDGNVGEYFWSSTERTAEYPFNLNFSTYGHLYLFGNDAKSDANRQVRAVLAF